MYPDTLFITSIVRFKKLLLNVNLFTNLTPISVCLSLIILHQVFVIVSINIILDVNF